MTAAVALDELRSGYGETEVLHGVSLTIETGSVYALIGKNGAGKSTLLKAMLGLLPAHGRVCLFGEDMAGVPAHKIAGRTVGYAPQTGAVFPDLTVRENLRMGATRLSDKAFEERCERAVELFPVLGSRMRQLAGTLSGGEQKMLCVSRALLCRPRIIALDEISEGLQPSAVDRICEALLAEQAASGTTILIIEQNIAFAISLASAFGLLECGEMRGEGRVTDPGAAAAIERHLAI
jgi:ABC-type branched-subunit amino acid transport system ATPase component